MHYDILARENVRIISPVISGSYRNFVPSEWFNVCLFLIRTVILCIITTERAVEFFSGALFGRQVSLFVFKFLASVDPNRCEKPWTKSSSHAGSREILTCNIYFVHGPCIFLAVFLPFSSFKTLFYCFFNFIQTLADACRYRTPHSRAGSHSGSREILTCDIHFLLFHPCYAVAILKCFHLLRPHFIASSNLPPGFSRCLSIRNTTQWSWHTRWIERDFDLRHTCSSLSIHAIYAFAVFIC